jgi:hypothetical protein
VRVLDRKLVRDLARMKGQVVTIALVVACGIASFVSALATYESLRASQRAYYETSHFAQVFARLERAPTILEARSARSRASRKWRRAWSSTSRSTREAADHPPSVAWCRFRRACNPG